MWIYSRIRSQNTTHCLSVCHITPCKAGCSLLEVVQMASLRINVLKFMSLFTGCSFETVDKNCWNKLLRAKFTYNATPLWSARPKLPVKMKYFETCLYIWLMQDLRFSQQYCWRSKSSVTGEQLLVFHSSYCLHLQGQALQEECLLLCRAQKSYSCLEEMQEGSLKEQALILLSCTPKTAQLKTTQHMSTQIQTACSLPFTQPHIINLF